VYGPAQFTQEDVMTCLTSLMEETDKDNKEEDVKTKKEEKEDEEEEEGENKSRKEAHCQKNICSLCKVKILPRSHNGFFYFL
jgi:hypothetical protein